MMNKSRIEYIDFTWNPVTGCQHGCPYCYAEKQATRFCGNVMINKASGQLKRDENGLWVLEKPFRNEADRVTPFPVKFEPLLREYCLPMPAQKKKPALIFVVSMGDLFGEWVPDAWIERLFEAAKAAPWHVYLFLTKNPGRYQTLAEAGKLPELDNFWYGTSVPTPETPWWYSDKHHHFVSIEPILGDFGTCEFNNMPEWVIVGAETGNRKGQTKRVKPEKKWIEAIIYACQRHYMTPLFMKDNLAPYWDRDLIQEFPGNLAEIHSKYAPRVEKH